MSDSTPLEPILARFLENRESLSDEEFSLLLEALRRDPHLAERLKDHLILDEVLAQQYAMDRKDFVEKFEQRLRAETQVPAKENGKPSLPSSSETYALHLPDRTESNGHASRPAGNGSAVPRKLAPPVVSPPPSGSSSHPWLKFSAVMAGLLLFAAGLLRLEYTAAARKIAEVDEVAGMVLIYRDEVGIVAAEGMPILPGDEIRAKENAQLKLTFRDRSRVTISAGSQVVFLPGTAHLPGLLTAGRSKELFLSEGTLAADVQPQPPGRPMILETPLVEAQVLGTRLILRVEAEQSRVEVIEGLVAVQSKLHQTEPPVEVPAGHQAVADKKALRVSPCDWPFNTQALVFLLSPNATQSRSPNAGVQIFAEGPNRSPSILRPRKKANFENGRMVFRGGAFLAEKQTATKLLAACRKSNALTVEASFQTAELSQTGPARWITFSTSSHAWNFTLAQEGNQCVLRLLTFQAAGGERKHELPLFAIPDHQPHHVAVTYAANRLRCYLDGKELPLANHPQGTFKTWKPQHLLFGDEWNGEREWKGELAGIAIYSRALSAEEIARNALHYRLQFPNAVGSRQ